MKSIEIDKIINPIQASDGAGVKLKRSIGVEPNYFDPFLMLDEFGSENSEDYIAGFPPHPHRGIETVTYSNSKISSTFSNSTINHFSYNFFTYCTKSFERIF